MAINQRLSDDLEAKAQELAARIRERADDDILALARLLVSKEDAEIFGDTEFEARDIVHRIGAKSFEERFKKKEKRTATKGRVPTVRNAAKTPSSKETDPKNRSV